MLATSYDTPVRYCSEVTAVAAVGAVAAVAAVCAFVLAHTLFDTFYYLSAFSLSSC